MVCKRIRFVINRTQKQTKENTSLRKLANELKKTKTPMNITLTVKWCSQCSTEVSRNARYQCVRLFLRIIHLCSTIAFILFWCSCSSVFYQTAKELWFQKFQGHFVYKKAILSKETNTTRARERERYSFDVIVDHCHHRHHHHHYRDKESKVQRLRIFLFNSKVKNLQCEKSVISTSNCWNKFYLQLE